MKIITINTKKLKNKATKYNFTLNLMPLKSNRVFSFSLVFAVILVPAFLFSNFVLVNKTNANLSKSPKSSDAMFVNVNPNFIAEFGDKNNPSKPTVKFNAVASNLNPITGDSVNISNNNSILDNLVSGFKENVLNDLDTKSIEFSLSNAKVDANSVSVDVSTTNNTSGINTGDSNPGDSLLLNTSTTENLSNLITDSINSKLDELEKSNIELGSKVSELKSQVNTLIDSSKDIYASTDLVEEKDKKDVVVNKSILPGVDAKYSIIEGKGVKEEIVINKLDSYDAKCYENIPLDKVSNLEELCSVPKNQYVFDLKLDKDVKVNRSITTTKTNPVPVWYFTDYYGRYLAHIDPPFAYDAKNNKTNNVSINISDGKIVLTVDLLWLLDPERAYPITIDPNITHDTQSEFATGTLNRVKDVGVTGNSPELKINYQELSKDPITLGLWHLNEGSGTTANDSSGNNLYLSFGSGNSAPAWVSGTNPLLGSAALYFDGGGDFVRLATTQFSVNDRTIELWVKANSQASFTPYLYYTDSNNRYGFSLSQDNLGTGKLYYNLIGAAGGTNASVTAPYSTADSKWHHYAITDNKNIINMYIDGELVASKASTEPVWTTDMNLYLGVDRPESTGSKVNFNGTIDEVRISNNIRKDAEIKADAQKAPYGAYTSDVIDLSNSNATLNSLSWTQSGVQTLDSQPLSAETLSTTANLIAQWNFNENSGTTAFSYSGTCGSNCSGLLGSFADTSAKDVNPNSGWTQYKSKWGNGALIFDGTNDYVRTPQSIGVSIPASFEIWVRPNSWPNSVVIFELTDNNNIIGGFDSEGVAKNLSFWWQSSANNYSAIRCPAPSVFKWSHIVGTIDSFSSNGMKMYYDGIEQNCTYYTNGSPSSTISQPVNFGTRDTTVYMYNGVLDTARIYSKSLTKDEIIENYNHSNIEFQTRSGPDTAPGFTSWQEWRPVSGLETITDTFDSNITANTVYSWVAVSPYSNYNWYKVNNNVAAASDSNSTDGQVPIGNNNKGDDVQVLFGKVIKENNNLYRMAYAGYDGALYGIFSASSPDGTNWQKLNNTTEPASNSGGSQGRIPPGLNTRGDDAGTLPGTYLKDGNTYWLWYSGNDAVLWSIMAATSNDGLTWTKINNSTEPASNSTGTQGRVPRGTSGTGDYFYTFQPSVIKDGSTYKMWYSAHDGTRWSILAATSNDGLTWTKINNSTEPPSNTTGTQGRIPLGLAGSGDASHTLEPVVIKQDNLYQMWYSGIAADNIFRTFMAVSYDGLTWTKVDNSTEPPSNWGFTKGRIGTGTVGTGDSQQIRTSSVINDNGNLLGWYFGTPTGTNFGMYTVKMQNNFLTASTNYAIKTEGTASLRVDLGKLSGNGRTVGLWHLDETGGSGAFYKDSSGYGNNATPASGTSAPSTALGILDQSLSFDGTNDYITCGTAGLTHTAPVTLEAWAYFNADQGVSDFDWVVQASGYTTPGDIFMIGRDASSNRMSYVDNNVVMQGPVIPTRTWTHLAMVFNTSVPYVRAYMNGIEYGISQPSSTITPQGPVNCEIGRLTPNNSHFMNGRIDEVKITNSALTSKEISNDYQLSANKLISKSISGINLTNKNKITFNIASDRPGNYLKFNVGESLFTINQDDSNTLLLWHFDDKNPLLYNSTSVPPSNWIEDSSQYSLNGTLATGSSMPIVTNGVSGSARYFDGNDYITTSISATHPIHIAQSSPVVISAWIYPIGTATSQLIVSKGFPTLSGYGLGIGSGTANVISLGNYGGGTLQAKNPLVNSNWYYIVGVINNSNSKIYINGALDSTGGVSTITSTQPVVIGAGQTQTGSFLRFFNGYIDEVRISNTEPSAADILQSYELEARSHKITIDFAAKLDTALVGTTNGSGLLSTTALSIDATYFGTQYKGSNLFKDDKVILKENYNGTEYLAQGLVTSITSGGAVTLSSWDSGSSFPPKGTSVCGGSDTHCFGTNASVFKWQREYFDLSSITTGTGSGDILNQRDSITNLTFRITNGNEGRTIFLDDLKYSSPYITSSPYTSFGTTNHTSNNRFVQYRAIFTTTDGNVSSTLSLINLNYTAIPALDQIMRHGKWFSGGTKQPFWWVN